MGKIWIWTKVIVFFLVFLYVAILCSINFAHKTEVWLWYNKTIPSNLLAVSVGSFLFGVIVTLLVRTTLVTMRQLREMNARKRSDRLHRDVEDMKNKAAMLQSRPTSMKAQQDAPDSAADTNPS